MMISECLEFHLQTGLHPSKSLLNGYVNKNPNPKRLMILYGLMDSDEISVTLQAVQSSEKRLGLCQFWGL